MKKEDVDKMTLQEAVEYSVTKIVEQGGQCRTNTNCSYGDGQGNHCAIGWLLDETCYGLMVSGFSVRNLSDSSQQELVPNLIKDNIELFTTLQVFHDLDRANSRRSALRDISLFDINTSNPNFEKWVMMGG